MAEKRQLEFLLLRYVPDAVKGEFVNFGLVAIGDRANGAELIDVRFTKDRARLLCLDPQADVDLLEALEREVRGEIGQTRDRAALLRRMEDSFSGVIQISRVMPALTEKTAAMEIDDVARMFLESPKVKRERETAGRRKILETMQGEFKRAGVLGLLNAVPAEPYTKPGDPFEFDFGYRVGQEIKLFHAVSMRASVDAAVLLAARYPKIVPVMAQLTATTPMLTAVVEAELDKSRSDVGFALEMMEESRIRVASTREMADIAKVARVELRA
ncbi:MAG TPA: DUF3037 domain-containing protein [Terriglobales bacterium]|nr:DUF3037 domain-containing protein [Terriglobales bacterium]